MVVKILFLEVRHGDYNIIIKEGKNVNYTYIN